jgi:hypothetical protein
MDVKRLFQQDFSYMVGISLIVEKTGVPGES